MLADTDMKCGLLVNWSKGSSSKEGRPKVEVEDEDARENRASTRCQCHLWRMLCQYKNDLLWREMRSHINIHLLSALCLAQRR